jgi:two-component system C4-dicarboxylate transport sensor histidine kinase DctB
VQGEAIRVEQVLVNLLDNALDACAAQPAPCLCISTRRDGDSWTLSVADNGGGIDPQHLPSLFDPFFTTKPVGEGLGLGLAISYGILRDLGGSLQAANGAQGAIFTLRLPAVEDAGMNERQRA